MGKDTNFFYLKSTLKTLKHPGTRAIISQINSRSLLFPSSVFYAPITFYVSLYSMLREK